MLNISFLNFFLKVQRATKAKEDLNWHAKELESKIDIKGLAADLRREEARLKMQDELSALNYDKACRGKLALGLAEVESQQVGLQSERKIVAASHRREIQHALAQARKGQAAAEKKEKAADARRQEDEETAKRRDDINARIKLAEERKNRVLTERKQSLSQVTDKLQRAADARRQEEERAKDESDRFEAKVDCL